MKRKILILIIFISLFLIGTIFAVGEIINRDKIIGYDKEIIDALKTKGIESWNTEDFENSDEMKRCITSPSPYNLPCSNNMPTFFMNCILRNDTTGECINEIRIDYTEEEKESILDNWEKERMNEIGNAINERANEQSLEKYAEGTTTPNNN